MRTVSLFILLALSSGAVANGDNLAAHVHGAAKAQLAVDGGRIEMALTAPMIDIAGFEGEAQSPERKAQLDAGLRALEGVARAMRFEGGSCTLDSATASPAMQSDDHDHDHHHDHHHKHESAHSAEHVHADIELNATWTCGGTVELVAIDPWKAFASLETLAVEWIGAQGQGAVTLKRSETDIAL